MEQGLIKTVLPKRLMYRNNNAGTTYHRPCIVVNGAVATMVCGIAIVMRCVAMVAGGIPVVPGSVYMVTSRVPMVTGGITMVARGISVVAGSVAMVASGISVVACAIRRRRVVNNRVMRHLGAVKPSQAVCPGTAFKPNSNYVSAGLRKRHIGCALYIGQVKQGSPAPCA